MTTSLSNIRTKYCGGPCGCWRTLDITRFDLSNISQDGHQSHCKECKSLWNRVRRQALRSILGAGDAVFRSGRNREAQAANHAVKKAIAQGILVPEPCGYPGCGCTEKVQADHHKGYAKQFWLDVIWRCQQHHRHRHEADGTAPRSKGQRHPEIIVAAARAACERAFVEFRATLRNSTARTKGRPPHVRDADANRDAAITPRPHAA